MAAAALTSASPAGAASGPLANPKANRPLPALADSTGQCTRSASGTISCPSPCYPRGVLVYNASKKCTDLLLTAINEAQASEHRARFSLPSNYFSLDAVEQLFVLVNLERLSHGVSLLAGLSPYLDSESERAAAAGQDPQFHPSYGPVKVWAPPAGGTYAFGGAWAGNSVNAAAAVFGWFYDDGWGGKGNTWNFACTGPHASGCWGHRDQLLGEWAGTRCPDCIAGDGYASPAARSWQESYVVLIVRPVTFPTRLDFTWNGGILPYLPQGWERARAA